MTSILLYIKTRLNEGGEFKASEVVNTWLKKVLDRYFIWFYIVSIFIFFSIISFVSIGFGAENGIEFLFINERFPTLNFYNYISVLILGSLFFKLMSETAIKQNKTFFHMITLYFQNPTKRLWELNKFIFFNGYGFRILVSSLFAIPIVIPFYFSANIYLNIFIAYTVLFFAIVLLNAVETLLYVLEQNLSVNTSVFTIVLFVVGFVTNTYFDANRIVNLIDFAMILGLLLFSSLAIHYYVKTKL